MKAVTVELFVEHISTNLSYSRLLSNHPTSERCSMELFNCPLSLAGISVSDEPPVMSKFECTNSSFRHFFGHTLWFYANPADGLELAVLIEKLFCGRLLAPLLLGVQNPPNRTHKRQNLLLARLGRRTRKGMGAGRECSRNVRYTSRCTNLHEAGRDDWRGKEEAYLSRGYLPSGG